MSWNPNGPKVFFTEIQIIAEVPLWQTERSTGILQVAVGSWDTDEGAGKVGIDVRKYVYTDRKGWQGQGGVFITDEAAVEPTAQAMIDALAVLQTMAANSRQPTRTRKAVAAPAKKAGGTATTRKAVGADPAPKPAAVRGKRTPSAAAPRRRTL